jgi:prevent-host-death family protein
MKTIGVRELKQHTSRIIRSVREDGESFEVTYHGKVVARITPAEDVEEPDLTLNESCGFRVSPSLLICPHP